jgi:hypothetical protein
MYMLDVTPTTTAESQRDPAPPPTCGKHALQAIHHPRGEATVHQLLIGHAADDICADNILVDQHLPL